MARAHSELLLLAVHELRDPIAVIRGYARMLSDDTGEVRSVREQHEIVSAVTRSAEVLVRLVDALSDIANLERETLPLNFLGVTVGSMLSEVVSDVNVASTDGLLSMDASRSAAAVRIQADPVRLSRALKAILSAMTARATAKAELVVRITAAGDPAPSAVTIVVGDRAEVDRISRRQGRRVDFGEGDDRLRLEGFLARRIIEAHGGQVWDTQAGPAVIELPVASRRRTRKSARTN